MQVSRFIKWLTSSVCALTVTSSAYAAKKDCGREYVPCKEEVCCEMPPAGPYGYNYAKDVGLSCPSDFYFHIDLLIFQPKMEGLEYAVTNTSGNAPTIVNTNNGFPLTGGEVLGFSSDHHEWEWEYGVRAGAGFYTNHDAWNIDLTWLWFKTNQEVSSGITNSGVLVPIWIKPQEEGAIANGSNAQASARWHADINEFDISIGKPYMVSPYFMMEPYVGIRAAWFDMHYTARYGGLIVINPGATPFIGAKMDADNDFWGVGTRAGLYSEYGLGGGWGLFANLAFAMLFSKFDIHQEMPLGVFSYEFNEKFYTNTPNMDLVLGVSWGTYLNHHRHRFSIQGTYEFQEWWNINWLRRILDSDSVSGTDFVSRGNFSFNGVSIRFLFDF